MSAKDFLGGIKEAIKDEAACPLKEQALSLIKIAENLDPKQKVKDDPEIEVSPLKFSTYEIDVCFTHLMGVSVCLKNKTMLQGIDVIDSYLEKFKC